MLSFVYLSGRLAETIGHSARYIEMERPIACPGGKSKIDRVPVFCPLSKSTLFFKAPKGTFVVLKGRLETNEELGLHVHSEAEEIHAGKLAKDIPAIG